MSLTRLRNGSYLDLGKVIVLRPWPDREIEDPYWQGHGKMMNRPALMVEHSGGTEVVECSDPQAYADELAALVAKGGEHAP